MKWHLLAKLILIAGSSADSASSWHKPELNPLLSHNGVFDQRSVMIKAALLTGQLAAQHELTKHQIISERDAALVNFGEGIALGAVAARNWNQGGVK